MLVNAPVINPCDTDLGMDKINFFGVFNNEIITVINPARNNIAHNFSRLPLSKIMLDVKEAVNTALIEKISGLSNLNNKNIKEMINAPNTVLCAPVPKMIPRAVIYGILSHIPFMLPLKSSIIILI